MQTTQHREFTNKHGDKVDVLLMQDSFGSFHLIVKAQLLRVETQLRFKGSHAVELETRTFTKETKHTNISDEFLAMNEFNLERVMHNDPTFSSADYMQWQTDNKPNNE